MPPYDWEAVAATNFAWLADRARRSAALFDGYRVDHLVGFYRTYSRPRSGEGEASPVTRGGHRACRRGHASPRAARSRWTSPIPARANDPTHIQ